MGATGDGEAAGEPDDRRLGRGVRGVGRQPEHAGGGRHDDPAVALLDHLRPGRPGGVERAADMDGQVAGKVVLVGVGEGRPTG